MEKVNATKKIALFMMTKRVARPMKFAAFISIIISVAVIFAACQGGPGGQGEQGETGETGETGEQGERGPQGIPGAAALTVRDGVNLIVSVNDGEDQEGAATVGDTAETRAMSSFFAGGTTSVVFSASAPETFDVNETATDNQVDVSDDGTTVTIKLKEEAEAEERYDPDVGYPVVITAKDDTQGITHTQTLKVVRNAAPASGTGTTAIPELLIGALGAETPEGSDWPGGEIYTCAMLNSCEFTPIVTSSDDSDAAASHFHDFGDLTYEVVSSDTAKVDVMGGKTVTIIGKASTAVTPDEGQLSNTFADQGVTITVTAVDGSTRKSEPKSFMVIVNAPPARNDTPVPSYTITESGNGGAKTLDVALLITDSDTAADTLVYTIRDNDDTHPHVTAAIDNSVLTLTATTNGTDGDRTVTVRVSEATATQSSASGSVGQYLDIPIMVTNSSN